MTVLAFPNRVRISAPLLRFDLSFARATIASYRLSAITRAAAFDALQRAGTPARVAKDKLDEIDGGAS